MAAPLVSGSAAILMEDMQKNSKDYDPFVIKNILMSTANDLQNDPLTQGSGLADIHTALKFVNEEPGIFIVHNDASYLNIKKIIEPAMDAVNSTSIGFEKFQIPPKPFPMTSWFAGHLLPGERTTATFTIENPSDSPIPVHIKAEELSLMKKNMLNGTTVTRQQDPILNKSGTFIPNYVKLSDVREHKQISELFEKTDPIPDDSSLMILNVNFPFQNFMNETADIYADDMKISSLYLYDWIDKNNDTKIVSDELSMVSRAGSWGTVQELRISEPDEKFEGTPLVGVYPVPSRYSYWLGDTKLNSTSMDYTLSASYYQKEKWSALWPETESVIVPARDSAKVKVTLFAPNELQTGIYQGFLTFESEHHVVNAPVSFVIKKEIEQKDSTVIISGKQSDDIVFGNGYIKGAFDMVNRYMAGDWRQYYFEIKDETINSASLELSWESDDSNLSVFVMDPKGKIIQTNMPSGVFGHFMGWPSLDWLGNSLFSQGGGFFPVKNKDKTSTVLFVPINQTGTYSLLAHSTLFGGNHTTEPVTIAAKFSNLSPTESEMILEPIESETNFISNKTEHAIPLILQNITKSEQSTNSMPIESQEDSSTLEPKPTESQEDSSTLESKPIESQERSSSNGLTIGLILGIAVGIAIGTVFVFIIRRKSTK